MNARPMRNVPARLLAMLIALVALAVVTSSSALASGKPTRVYAPIPPGITTPCTANVPLPFVVLIDVLRNDEHAITFFDDAGNAVRQIIQGALSVRFTNTTNGHSINVNISGPGVITFMADGSVIERFEGLSAIPIDGQLLLSRGAVTVLILPDGSSHVVNNSAPLVDACTMLV